MLSAITRGVTAFAAMLLVLLWSLIQTVTQPQTDSKFVYQWADLIPVRAVCHAPAPVLGVLRGDGHECVNDSVRQHRVRIRPPSREPP